MRVISGKDASWMAYAIQFRSLLMKDKKRTKEIIKKCELTFTKDVVAAVLSSTTKRKLYPKAVQDTVAHLERWYKAVVTIHSPKRKDRCGTIRSS